MRTTSTSFPTTSFRCFSHLLTAHAGVNSCPRTKRPIFSTSHGAEASAQSHSSNLDSNPSDPERRSHARDSNGPHDPPARPAVSLRSLPWVVMVLQILGAPRQRRGRVLVHRASHRVSAIRRRPLAACSSVTARLSAGSCLSHSPVHSCLTSCDPSAPIPRFVGDLQIAGSDRDRKRFDKLSGFPVQGDCMNL